MGKRDDVNGRLDELMDYLKGIAYLTLSRAPKEKKEKEKEPSVFEPSETEEETPDL
jgi:hypothetical protein